VWRLTTDDDRLTGTASPGAGAEVVPVALRRAPPP
jgi:hypothetical protein